MSKKQKKSVEKVEVKSSEKFCKDCSNRNSGAEAKREGLCGYCKATKEYVARKAKICDEFKGK